MGRLCLALLVSSAGMFISSTAFLPSSTSMYLTLLAMGAWFLHHYKLAIFFTAFSTFISKIHLEDVSDLTDWNVSGWPFAALLGLPIAVDIVIFRRQLRLFLDWSVASALIILLPQVLCDSHYYGKPVLASLNIVLYNVFTPHGPDLYGTEPAQFYLLNGFLNFNLVFLLALVGLPVLLATKFLLRSELAAHTTGLYLSETLSQAPLCLWLLVFWTRPHKEERFLFPVYPLICLSGAMVIDAVQKVAYYLLVEKKVRHYLQHTNWLGLASVLLTGLLSLSRIVALHQAVWSTRC